MNEEEAMPLPIQEIRGAVKRWSQAGFFRAQDLSERMEPEKIIPQFAYTIRLKSEVEHRGVTREAVPYHGGPVDDTGVPPHPWDIAVPMPQDFEDRQEQVVIPHTERVETCGTCGGWGQVMCGNCGGSGQTTCPWCGGAGYRTRTETYTEKDPDGNTQIRTEEIRESCSCFNGRVTCSTCGGNGRVMCPGCQGSGKVKTFDLLTVTFREDRKEAVVDTSDVPDKLIGNARGERIVNLQEERIAASPPVVPAVKTQADGLLSQSQQLPDDTRLLFQRLFIERVGVHEVHYRYKNSDLKRLWVYGEPKQVYAPGAPRAWGRIGSVLAATLTLIGTILYFTVLQPAPTDLPQSAPVANSASPTPPDGNNVRTTEGYEGRIEQVPVNPTPEAEIESLREQIRRSPNDAVLHDSLAQLYLRQKQPDKAAYHLKQVIKLIPDTERARTAEQTLKRIQSP